MKKIIFAGVLFLAAQCMSAQLNSKLQAYAKEVSYNKQKQLSFIKLNAAPEVNESDVAGFINAMIFNNNGTKVAVLKTESDKYGFTHTRYGIQQNNVTLYNKIIIAHCQNGKLVSLNGDLRAFAAPANGFALSEKTALAAALKKVNAKKYKWENKAEEAHMREVLNQPGFSYYPTGTKVIFEKEGKPYNAYQFTIYAEEPLYRAHVFVDAATGKILGEQNLICNINTPGTAATKYSGTQPITCDQNGASYRLRESQRGLGVETYNLNNNSNYVNTDFTNGSATWTGVNADQGARDAHWGAESTYDFYSAKFGINSIDNAGFKLLSYVHYNSGYNNAFWDGFRMTYGDGNGSSFTIFTCLDVCGHEITHGLVNNTANLGGSGSDECDALNEGWADIFGTSIERYARPGNWNWVMGNEITTNNNGIRNMQNPNSLGDPDTYMGNFWDFGGEPHANACPAIYWYYLLVNSGSGTNDNGSFYNISGIGNTDAEQIAYRALTVYFTPSTDYVQARAATIQAAKDLFGNCSNQVIQTTNAWYAVGVGNAYSNSVGPDFQAPVTSFCALPANVNFNNTTASGITYTWDFGDGSTSTSVNVLHSYVANGTYAVKLKATGCNNALDSITKMAYIVVNAPDLPAIVDGSNCGSGSVALSATGNAALTWYSVPGSTVVLGTGNTFNTPNISSTTTYYVVNTVTASPAYGGLTSNVNGGFLANATQWLVFDVLQNSTLNSVVMYAQNGGSRVIELRDQFNTVIYSTTANLLQGANTVTLNYVLTPGNNYQLGLNFGSTSNLYRTNNGVNFPYSIGGCVNLTSSSAGTGFYYWFYNWKVTKEMCSSPAMPVSAVIYNQPVASVSAPLSQSCSGDDIFALTGSPAGGTFSGQGMSGSNFNPSVAGVGSHTITYSYSDANSCSDTDNLVLNVSECTGIPSFANATSLAVYPNPLTDHVTIKSDFKDRVTASITDATGRLVISQSIMLSEQDINTAHLAKGIYVLSIQDASGKTLKALKLVKE